MLFRRPQNKANHHFLCAISRRFEHVGGWILSPEQRLLIDRELPKAVGVYAFAKGDDVLYVGVATMGLAKRLYFYGRPGVSQRTSLRINAIIIDELARHPKIDVSAFSTRSRMERSADPRKRRAGARFD